MGLVPAPPIATYTPSFNEGGISVESAVLGGAAAMALAGMGFAGDASRFIYEGLSNTLTGVADAASQLWGQLNQTKPQPIGYIPATSTTSQVGYVQSPTAQGNFSIAWAMNADNNLSHSIIANDVSSLSIDKEYYENMPWTGTTGDAIIIRGYTATGAQNFGYALRTPGPGYILFDGPVAPVITLTYLRFYWNNENGLIEELEVIPYEFVGPVPGTKTRVPYFPLVAPVPTVQPIAVPFPQPQPEPEKKVAPPITDPQIPQPTPQPTPGPQPSPSPQPTPQPATTPTTTPSPFIPVILPQVTPNTTTQTNADGSRKTAPIVGPITTPVGSEKIGPITIPTNAPQATLAGIAGEVGRIEQKLAKMIRPPADGDLTDRLGLLGSVLKALYEEFFTGLPSGEYILTSSCEKLPNGNRIEYEVPILATQNRFDAIFERLDALADLIQTHKDLKQPICRGTQPTGQPVTVNFTQIE
jgi:hypothetical protein